MKKIKIAITGTGSLIGQAIIKSIRASGLSRQIEMIGFDYFENTIGSFWTSKNFILPDFLKKNVMTQSWLEKIMQILEKEKIKILFVGLDFELKPFAQYRRTIESETGCKIMVSSPEVIKISDDKYLTYKFLKDNNLYYPETFLPHELKKQKIKFPCFIKPRISSRSRDAFVINDKEELNYFLPRIKNPLIQELVGNPDMEYTCGVICFDAEVRQIIVLRRELKDGNTSVAYFSKNTSHKIYDYVKKVAQILNPFGACNFQLRLGNDNKPKIFEINARHSGTTYIRALFGFNEVEYILSYILGKKTKSFSLKEGIVKRYYDEIFIAS
jgi:carbamoyl-phosphate synthase large subunit